MPSSENPYSASGSFNGEVRTVSRTGAAKGVKPEAFDLIPPYPLFEMAKWYGCCPAELSSSQSWSAVFNYTCERLWSWWGGENVDPNCGLHTMVSAAAGCFTLIDFSCGSHPHSSVDDRPSRGQTCQYTPVTVSCKEATEFVPRFDLIPYSGMVSIARHYGAGSVKYSAHNWAAGYEWSKPFAALMRHLLAFWNGEDIDVETGSPHIVASAWHCLTMVEFAVTHPEFDDRPVRGTQDTFLSLSSRSAALT